MVEVCIQMRKIRTFQKGAIIHKFLFKKNEKCSNVC